MEEDDMVMSKAIPQVQERDELIGEEEAAGLRSL
jgi:hypothetical protein